MPIVRATFGYGVIETETYNEAVKGLKDGLRILNTHLQGRTHLVGNTTTVADIVVAFHLTIAFQVAIDGGFRKSAPNVTAWMENFVALPEVVKRVGRIQFCQKVIKAVAHPKKEEKKVAT